MTSPDLIMVNGLPEMTSHVKGLFKAFKDEPFKILLGYDTQFNLTNGYVWFKNHLSNMQICNIQIYANVKYVFR